uniref:diacylglycerol O-acyltransferase n=1 Tax=Nothobranchius furzeri TaxID=105023 RepID=A0A8C6MIX4_NOTFU
TCLCNLRADSSLPRWTSVLYSHLTFVHMKMLLCSCHNIQDSLLSSNSNFTGYRGILNWIIILLVSFSSLSSFIHHHHHHHPHYRHGFLIDVRKVLGHLIEDSCNWPSVNLLLGGAFFSLWFYIILSLKLYSYQETNCWYRQALLGISASLSLPRWIYLYYFLCAPTLCYQRDFPRTPKVRINKLLHRLLEMVSAVVTSCLDVSLTTKFSFTSHTRPEETTSVGRSAPTHFLWLLFFFLTHSYLNFCAELLCFGDRHFYGDWWNAQTLISFWNTWNIPFQKWINRYCCCLFFKWFRSEGCRFEPRSVCRCRCYLVALPLHSCRLWIFLVMVSEGNYGNGLVWLCLLLGPPLAVTTYFHDHYIGSHHHSRSISAPLASDHRVFLQLY